MLQEQGTVVAFAGAGKVWVEVERGNACGHCSSSTSCGTGALAQFVNKNRHNRVCVDNHAAAVIGERVTLGIDEQALLRASLWGYLLPLCGLFTGAALCGLLGDLFGWTPNDGWRLLAALTGLGVGFWLLRGLSNSRYRPVMLEKL